MGEWAGGKYPDGKIREVSLCKRDFGTDMIVRQNQALFDHFCLPKKRK
jgi:hypothetical protein